MIGQRLAMVVNSAKNEQGKFGLGRILTWVGAIMLTVAFNRESLSRELAWMDYIAYPVGMMIVYAPAKATDIIKAIGEALRGDLMFPVLALSVRPYLYGAITLAVIAAGVTIKFQFDKIDKLKEDNIRAQEANKTNEKTITEILNERDSAITTCEARLSAKDTLIKRLRDIEVLRPSTVKPGSPVVVGSSSGGTDTVLDILERVLSGPTNSQDGVYSAVSTSSPGEARAVPGSLVYCLDEVGAKNLLKNFTTLLAWAEDMRTILMSMQTGTR